MPPLQSPASARRSTGDAARDQPIPRRLPSHCLLHRCKHRCLHHCAITPHQTDRRKAPFAGWVPGFYGCKLGTLRGYLVPTDNNVAYATAHSAAFDRAKVKELGEHVKAKFSSKVY